MKALILREYSQAMPLKTVKDPSPGPPLESGNDILEKIREKTFITPKDDLIIEQGRWAQPYPTRKQLHQVAPDYPVLPRKEDGH